MVIIDEIAYIIDIMRERGVVTVNNGVISEYPCDAILSCEPCTKIDTLTESGSYQYHLTKPYFYYGSKNEILSRLEDKGKRNNIKYPAIFLEMPFFEKYVSMGKAKEVTLTFLFVNIRQKGWTYQQSIEQNIKPIILPMMEKFKKASAKSESVMNFEPLEDAISPNYGNDKLMANDYWDVVQLKANFIFNSNCKKLLLCQT